MIPKLIAPPELVCGHCGNTEIEKSGLKLICATEIWEGGSYQADRLDDDEGWYGVIKHECMLCGHTWTEGPDIEEALEKMRELFEVVNGWIEFANPWAPGRDDVVEFLEIFREVFL
jgi:hypothetical protein